MPLKLNAELIVIMTTKNIGFADYVLGADEQYIICQQRKNSRYVHKPYGRTHNRRIC
jgi:hypothetical protein